MSSPPTSGTQRVQILRIGGEVCGETPRRAFDRVAVEAPLELFIHPHADGWEPVSFGATMRTPGEDDWLAAGLLFGEGIIDSAADIEAIESSTRRPNVVNVRLKPSITLDVSAAKRRYSAGSSCGVCGTTGLDAAIARAAATQVVDDSRTEIRLLLTLPQRMREAQTNFGATGGIHAAALFDMEGTLLGVAEDVGRHNAFDKLVGEQLLNGQIPLTGKIVVLSGRASFELVQKALRAQVSVLAAVGAPSSLAVKLAVASGLTLAGFLRAERCNIYAHEGRLLGTNRADGTLHDR